MKSLQYIEDYILLMATDYLTWPPPEPIIKLARYDEPIVNSMSDQIQRNIGFTDKQALLAHKIVVKYKRQWALVGYDISKQESNGLFRLPIRVIDRSKVININNGKIEIRFPYDQESISYIRAAVNNQPGQLYFDKQRHCWLASLIEPRLIWAKEFGAKYNFEFGDEFRHALELMSSTEDYAISLKYNGNNFEITNAAETLIEYINSHGGFDNNNTIRLIDLSGVLGYQVDNTVYQQLEIDLDVELIQMLTERSTNIVYDTKIDLSIVVEYAELTKRFPIYIYESGSNTMRGQLEQYFKPEEIVDRKSLPQSLQTGKVIYFNHWKSADARMPLLVTTHTLMIGNRRQQMLHSADKVIFFSQRINDDQVPTSN